jgi:bifunctional UDP-N-acetylglucosamine pyrophosphorylase/glucosamine-1-phosphate N-acetyltransferase
MLRRVLDVADTLTPYQTCVVVSPHVQPQIMAVCGAGYDYVPQHERRGTAHAVLQTLSHLRAATGYVIVLFGDTPLLQAHTILQLLDELTQHRAHLGLVSFTVPAPHNYGRIVRNDGGDVIAIVEAKNCTPEQARITEANSGIMIVDATWLRTALPLIPADSVSNEFYLTDLVALCVAHHGVGSVRGRTVSDVSEAWGVNDRIQLATAEAMLHARTTQQLMSNGVTITNPSLVTIEPEVRIGADSVILPGCVLRGHTTIGQHCVIGPHTTLDDCMVGDNCTIPHSMLKQGTIDTGTDVEPFTHMRH